MEYSALPLKTVAEIGSPTGTVSVPFGLQYRAGDLGRGSKSSELDPSIGLLFQQCNDIGIDKICFFDFIRSEQELVFSFQTCNFTSHRTN